MIIFLDLWELFCNYTFVGFVNQTKALLQYEVSSFTFNSNWLFSKFADRTFSSGYVNNKVGVLPVSFLLVFYALLYIVKNSSSN